MTIGFPAGGGEADLLRVRLSESATQIDGFAHPRHCEGFEAEPGSSGAAVPVSVVLQTSVWVDLEALAGMGRGLKSAIKTMVDLLRRCQVLDSKRFPSSGPPGRLGLGIEAVSLS